MAGIAYLGWFVIAVVVIIAQFRLFSIDSTLKEILAELKSSRAENARRTSSGLRS